MARAACECRRTQPPLRRCSCLAYPKSRAAGPAKVVTALLPPMGDPAAWPGVDDVAGASNGEQMPRTRRVLFDLVAQSFHMLVQRLRIAVVARPPHLVHQLVPGDHLAGV